MSFTPATSKTHDLLIRALAGKQGQTLRTWEIEELARSIGATDKEVDWLQPSDHCQNTPAGACKYAGTNSAQLAFVERGVYRVLL